MHALKETKTKLRPTLIDLSDVLPAHVATRNSYEKDQMIFSPESENMRLYMVRKGQVVSKALSNNGTMVGIEILGPEDIFGLEAFVGPYATAAYCIEPTETLSWDVKYLAEIGKSNHNLVVGLMQAAINRVVLLQDDVERLATKTVRSRLITFLLKSARSTGIRQGNAVVLLGFSHKLIAEFVGTGREVVTSHMIKFKKEGFLSYSRRSGIRILNLASFTAQLEADEI